MENKIEKNPIKDTLLHIEKLYLQKIKDLTISAPSHKKQEAIDIQRKVFTQSVNKHMNNLINFIKEQGSEKFINPEILDKALSLPTQETPVEGTLITPDKTTDDLRNELINTIRDVFYASDQKKPTDDHIPWDRKTKYFDDLPYFTFNDRKKLDDQLYNFLQLQSPQNEQALIEFLKSYRSLASRYTGENHEGSRRQALNNEIIDCLSHCFQDLHEARQVDKAEAIFKVLQSDPVFGKKKPMTWITPPTWRGDNSRPSFANSLFFQKTSFEEHIIGPRMNCIVDELTRLEEAKKQRNSNISASLDIIETQRGAILKLGHLTEQETKELHEFVDGNIQKLQEGLFTPRIERPNTLSYNAASTNNHSTYQQQPKHQSYDSNFTLKTLAVGAAGLVGVALFIAGIALISGAPTHNIAHHLIKKTAEGLIGSGLGIGFAGATTHALFKTKKATKPDEESDPNQTLKRN